MKIMIIFVFQKDYQGYYLGKVLEEGQRRRTCSNIKSLLQWSKEVMEDQG